MNKIDEIKERMKMYEAIGSGMGATREDVEYLISKLEVAEKVLERLSTENFSAPIEFTQVEAYQKYAVSALERLRDDRIT